MTPEALADALRDQPDLAGVRLVVLHGSRARADDHDDSDWDVAVRPGPATDLGTVTATLVRLVGSEAVDVVDLDRAGALLRYRAARDGLLLLGGPEEFLDFREQAVRYWCDAGPVIRAALGAVLDDLDRPA